MTKPKHERTRDIQKSLETREKFPISYFDSRQYIQHNVNLEDGLGPVLALMDALPADRTKVEPLRSFEDGDYSVAHLNYVLGDWGPMVGFEIHRWDNDRIVEHWDNLQSTPSAPNASGRTMIDGAIEITDLDRTDANKALVRGFTKQVLIAGSIERIGEFHVGETLLQHSPAIGDGTGSLVERIAGGRDGREGPVHRTLHMVLGQGSQVLAVSEGVMIDGAGSEQSAAFYDLYRCENGRIVEHWEVVEVIPPRDQWKNDNGKF